MVFDMPSHEWSEQLTVFFAQGTLLDQNIPNSPRLVGKPLAGCSHQLIPSNETHLDSDDSKKQILIGL